MIDFEKAVACIDLSGFPIAMRLEVYRVNRSLRLTAVMSNVPDRETKQPTSIYHTNVISNYALECFTMEEFVEYLWRFVHSAVAHEADEHFLVNGVRVFDPHVSASPRQGR